MTTKKAKAQARSDRAAALLAERKRKEKRRNLLSIGGVGLVMALIVGGAVLFQVLNKDEVKASDAGSSDYGLLVGPDDAPHEVIVYEDFLCPVCEAFESAADDRLSELAAEGKVQIDYRPISIFEDFSYSADSLNAFFVVQDAAGDDVAKLFHDLLYDDQPAEQGPYPDNDWLVAKAVEAGAVEADVRPGIEGDAKADAVEAASKEAEDAGVGGTPTILLDGVEFRDGKTWDDIAANLAAAIEK